MDADLEYLHDCLRRADFTPYPWEGEDRNIGAFRSKEEFIAWYCQPPGVEGEPYRDRGFYTRELAMLSALVQPKVVVEFGTSLGIGTCLLRWLNPEADLATVDNSIVACLPGGAVEMGYLARLQEFSCKYVYDVSWAYARKDVGLCFIDADHRYEGVIKDSWRAWNNRADRYAIAWHDHNDRHPGVLRAVEEFCSSVGAALQSRPDSDTVWITNV